jgi:molecular chaperone DnaK
VSARDKGTGKQQSIRIEASSGLTDDEIKRMREEAKAHEDEDRKAREKVEKLNAADSLIFQTEKQLKEFGDKIPPAKKEPIEKALANLKEVHKTQDVDAIEKATGELNAVWQLASEEMYKASQNAGSGQDGSSSGQPEAGSPKGESAGSPKDAEVTDVDFEEVK